MPEVRAGQGNVVRELILQVADSKRWEVEVGISMGEVPLTKSDQVL